MTATKIPTIHAAGMESAIYVTRSPQYRGGGLALTARRNAETIFHRRNRYRRITRGDVTIGWCFAVDKQERVKRYGEVFTPSEIASQMCDMLSENSNIDPFTPAATFLEPSCGEGVFVLEVLRRKFERCKTQKDFETAALSVYGFEIQADNVEITIGKVLDFCEQHFRVSKKVREEIKSHFILCDALKVMKLLAEYGDGTKYICVREIPKQEA